MIPLFVEVILVKLDYLVGTKRWVVTVIHVTLWIILHILIGLIINTIMQMGAIA